MDTEKKIEFAEVLPDTGATVIRGTSLRQKGLWTLFAMVVYCVIMTLVITVERSHLFNSIAMLESIHKQEANQVVLNMSVSRAILKSSPLPKPDSSDLFQRTLTLKFRPQS